MRKQIIFRSMVFLLIHTALTFYIGWNVWIWLHTAFGLQDKWGYAIVAALFSYSYFIGRFFKKWYFFTIVGSYWLAFLQYAILLFPLADLCFWLFHMAGFPNHLEIVWTGAVVFTAFVLLFSIGTYNAYSPVVRTYKIAIPKYANQRKSLRIAMASDMHFGHLSGLSHLRRLVEVVKTLEPDIILLPGDIIDDEPGPFIRKNMGEVMKDLTAPLGVYAVLGNHEYYGGAIPEFLKEMERIGVTMLLDEIVMVKDAFYLVGRKDKTDSKRKTMEELLAKIDPSLPIIVMDHQPSELKEAEKFGADLILSGHTHRGQIAPNHLITRKVFELDWGYMKKNQLHAIVSSGYGFWGPPLRIGSRSEVVLIEVNFSALDKNPPGSSK